MLQVNSIRQIEWTRNIDINELIRRLKKTSSEIHGCSTLKTTSCMPSCKHSRYLYGFNVSGNKLTGARKEKRTVAIHLKCKVMKTVVRGSKDIYISLTGIELEYEH